MLKMDSTHYQLFDPVQVAKSLGTPVPSTQNGKKKRNWG